MIGIDARQVRAAVGDHRTAKRRAATTMRKHHMRGRQPKIADLVLRESASADTAEPMPTCTIALLDVLHEFNKANLGIEARRMLAKLTLEGLCIKPQQLGIA